MTITRGNGAVNVPVKAYLYYERFTPRKDHWSLYWHLRYAAEGLDGPADGAMEFDFNPTYFVNDSLISTPNCSASTTPIGRCSRRT